MKRRRGNIGLEFIIVMAIFGILYGLAAVIAYWKAVEYYTQPQELPDYIRMEIE